MAGALILGDWGPKISKSDFHKRSNNWGRYKRDKVLMIG